MKTNCTITTLAAAFLFGTALTGAHAASLLKDGSFETLAVGTAPNVGKAAGRWHFDDAWPEATASQVSIAPAPAGGDGNSLRMSLAATETTSAEPEVLHQFPAVNRSTGKIIILTFDLYVEPGHGGADTSLAHSAESSDRAMQLRWNADGKLYNRATGSGDTSLFPYPRGVWQSVRVELDLAKDRYNLYLSEKGQPVALTRFNLPARSTGVAYVDRLSVVRFAGNPDVRAFYDNFRLTTDPAIAPVTADLAAGGATTLQVVNLPAGDVTFQWQRNGQDIAGATAATLELSNVTADAAGNYTVVVTRAGQSVTTEASTVRVFNQLTITTPPEKIEAASGKTTGFSVAAVGPLPLTYQWRFNGADLPGKTSRFLTFPANVAVAGDYSVVVSDANGSVVSDPARLSVLVPPTFVQPPLAMRVVAGSSVTFSAAVAGTGPFTYQWRKGTSFDTSTIRATQKSADPTAFFTLNNVQTSLAGTYRLCLGNPAAPDITATSPNRTFVVTVLPDTDVDGLPDEWETANGLNPADPADAVLDRDGNGITNLAEYRTGNATGLWVETVTPVAGQATVSFEAAPNLTYTVEALSEVGGGTWEKVADVVAKTSSRVETVTDPKGAENARFYRVVSPRRP